MVNLRTHRSMELHLSDRVNFIVGTNGSGKSTVLLAIALALGADAVKMIAAVKADASETAKNPLIRTGETQAEVRKGSPRVGLRSIDARLAPHFPGPTNPHPRASQVEIDIRNTGPEAFEVPLYGSVVTITRHLALLASGAVTSTFTITNKTTGAVVFKTKPGIHAERFAYLTNLVEALGLTPTNPIIILDQERSKKVLSSSSSADLYAHFVECTSLCQAYVVLVQSYGKIAEATRNIQGGEAERAQRREDLAKAQRKYDKVKALTELEAVIEDAQRDIVWAALRAPEAADASARAALASAKDALRKYTDAEPAVSEALAQAAAALAKTE